MMFRATVVVRNNVYREGFRDHIRSRYYRRIAVYDAGGA